MRNFTNRIGVSPAFLVSRYGKDFTPGDVCDGIEIVNSWGFSHLQIEIYHPEKIPSWLTDTGAKRVNIIREKTKLEISILVCHLFINEFSSIDSLFDLSNIKTIKEIISIAKMISTCRYILIPFGSFIDTTCTDQLMKIFNTYEIQFYKKFSLFYDLITKSGFKMLIELLPRTIFGNYEYFHKIVINKFNDKLGLLFDTGHAYAGGENILDIPTRYGQSIHGTHLCDNFGKESLSLAPGKGEIKWKDFLTNLINSNYNGYFDIEILCPKENVQTEYCEAQLFIKSLIENSLH